MQIFIVSFSIILIFVTQQFPVFIFIQNMNGSKEKVATLGAGCFWCVVAVFDSLKGVTNVKSGYTGGKIANPTYKEVCSGLTGHAEVVQITFNPDEITYSDLLDVFFNTHDPTTLNRQGADVGSQYRSVIFFHDNEQKKMAEDYIYQLTEAKVFDKKIITEVSPASEFYEAEEYHQDYFNRNPDAPYCTMVIEPKLKKFQEKFREKLQK
jgi:peptide-methionine (S)-S-oxide reductase